MIDFNGYMAAVVFVLAYFAWIENLDVVWIIVSGVLVLWGGTAVVICILAGSAIHDVRDPQVPPCD